MKKTDYYKCNPIDFYNIVLEFDRIDYFMNVLELLFDLAAIGVQYESFFIQRNVSWTEYFFCLFNIYAIKTKIRFISVIKISNNKIKMRLCSYFKTYKLIVNIKKKIIKP